MIVQACINGARSIGFHSNLPLTIASTISDSIKCVKAGHSFEEGIVR
jgi:uncharacterized protein (DUF849 family)